MKLVQALVLVTVLLSVMVMALEWLERLLIRKAMEWVWGTRKAMEKELAQVKEQHPSRFRCNSQDCCQEDCR